MLYDHIIAIQILFVPERNHWVATSYLQGEVQIYDSKLNGRLSAHLQEQLVQIYRPAIQNDGLIVTAVPVQQQTGSIDCGLFAIAFAYHAALGDNMRALSYSYEAALHSLPGIPAVRSISNF